MNIENVKSYQYQLLGEDYVECLSSDADMIVVDLDDSKFITWQVEQLKQSGKLMLSYLSIGQASPCRWYWNSAWVDAEGDPIQGVAPAWLGPKDPNWNSYWVKYWEEDWKEILKESLDRVRMEGYEGVIHDTIDAYWFWTNQGMAHETVKGAMKTLLLELFAYTKNAAPDWVNIPNSGIELLSEPDYIQQISAVLRESIFFIGDVPRTQSETDWLKSCLMNVKAAGKKVFVLEYPMDFDNIELSITKNLCEDYIPYVTDQALSTLAPIWLNKVKEGL